MSHVKNFPLGKKIKDYFLCNSEHAGSSNEVMEKKLGKNIFTNSINMGNGKRVDLIDPSPFTEI